MIEYKIKTIKNYPDNGKHQECVTDLPVKIKKGEDGYLYFIDGVVTEYNKGDELDQRWICHAQGNASISFKKIFKPKAHEDLNVILKYCVDLYLDSLAMEETRIREQRRHIYEMMSKDEEDNIYDYDND